MTKPRIAIPVPTSNNLPYNQRCWPQYAAAVERAGGVAVEVPLTLSPKQIADLINGCQGVLLPGSPADVNPQKYGQEADPASAAPDAARENVDELLIQDAHNLYKPVLALCFGLQFLNVWRGGTLVQDLTVMPVNHAASGAVATAHAVLIASDSLLGTMVDRAEAAVDGDFLRLPINSSHHQAIGIPGDGLRVVARCPQDGVIEAIEGGQAGGQGAGGAMAHFVLGLQWHPERNLEQSATSRAAFERFVGAAAAWQPRAIRVSVA
jgi:putative glutamine amidotransferase